MLADLQHLLSAVPATASLGDYRAAVCTHNVVGKRSDTARQRTFRYLRELYGLDASEPTFAALRMLWAAESAARPLLAMLSALARDPALRATFPPILAAREGSRITSDDLAASVQRQHPGDYKESVAAKIGRNALSSWQQSGHLVAVKRTTKLRSRAECRPPAVALALFVGHLEGGAGQGLLDTLYAQALDVPKQVIRDQAFTAAQNGWIDYREVGGVVEVTFRELDRGAA
jgi:hypothetical protein